MRPDRPRISRKRGSGALLVLAAAAAAMTGSAAAAPERKIDFRTQVLPVLQKSCFECHRGTYRDNTGKTREPKGGLRLDGAGEIMKGGSGGDAVVPGNPDRSSLYERILLPQDHEDAMPPKGKGAPLTFQQTETIKQWILEGADFGDWKGAGAPIPSSGTRPATPSRVTPDPAAASSPASEAEIEKVRKLGALVAPIAAGSNLLRVEWVSGAKLVTDTVAASLTPLGNHIAELDLSHTSITDATLKIIGKFPRLAWLKLNNTAVTDAGIAHLEGLAALDYLNLHSTGVTDASLPALTKLRKLRQVYLWNTRVTPSAAERFRKSIPDLQVQIE